MSDPKPPQSGRPASWFFGAALMALGALMVVLSGLCSLVAFVSFAGSTSHSGGNLGPALIGSGMTLAVFGGIPIAVGVGLFLVGRNLCRQR
jgi:hypothetical protein